MNKFNSAEKATILVVDDAPGNLALMHNLLKDDYQVKIANRGEKALQIAASDSPPDLILLDIMMPGMDGYEVCQRLKRDPRTQNIPVIFLTAKSEAGDEKKGLELGAIDYITKPISVPIVMARVKNHLALKAMADFLRDQNDWDSAERLAYTLRGDSGNVSVNGLQQFAEKLEVAIKARHSHEGIEARPDAPATQLDNLIAELDQKPPEASGRMTASVNLEKLKEVCGKLEALLAENDSEAINVLDANAELLDAALPNRSREIDNAIRSFDFEAALAALRAATGKSA
ncbi:MAG: response regulator [Sideroxyarcus sp.]|nr:response regulator [Sideroxyarcus sp.]